MYKHELLHYKDKKFDSFIDTIQKYASPVIKIKNADGCIIQIAAVHNKPTIFIANFSGLKGKENAIPFPKQNVTITFNNFTGREDSIKFIPFLGEPVYLKGQINHDQLTVSLPTIFWGTIVTVK